MKAKKLWVIPAAVITAATVTAVGIAAVAWQKKGSAWQAGGSSAEKAYDSSISAEESSAGPGANLRTGSNRRILTWEGRSYQYNDHLSNFLFMGVDKPEPDEVALGSADAGQSDALFLLSWDRVEGDVTVVSIPRDTITEIEMVAYSGESLGALTTQITLAYAYGDGKHESCRLTEEAVSDLLYGIPIQGYLAVAREGIPVLTETVDGVKVTVPDGRLEGNYPEFQEGARVILTPENTEAFVRYRDIEESQSALYRQARQEIFLDAFARRLKEKASEDAGILTRLYMNLEPHMVTNIGADQFVKIAEGIMEGGKTDRWTIPGTGQEGEKHDEYHVDENALYGKFIESFCVEIE